MFTGPRMVAGGIDQAELVVGATSFIKAHAMGIACVSVIRSTVVAKGADGGSKAGESADTNTVVQLHLGTGGCKDALQCRVVGNRRQIYIVEADGRGGNDTEILQCQITQSLQRCGQEIKETSSKLTEDGYRRPPRPLTSI